MNKNTLLIGVLILMISALAANLYVRDHGRALIAQPLPESAPLSDSIFCNDSADYFIITKEIPGWVGSDILVKYKASAGQSFDCAYIAEDGDFEIKNEDAEYFLGVKGDHLLIDSGTSPSPRGLMCSNRILKSGFACVRCSC